MTSCPVGLGKAINPYEPEIFHELQGGWFHLFFQQNMNLSHLSPSKFPSFLRASPLPHARRKHSSWKQGQGYIFPELPLASLGKSCYQLPAWLQLAMAQPEMWLQDAFCVFWQIQLPLSLLGWQVPGLFWWHRVSPVCVLEEASGLCQGPP